MITDTKDKILSYVSHNGAARVHDLVRELEISNVAVHKQLKNLLRAGLLKKEGKPPFVFYVFPLQEEFKSVGTETLTESTQRIIQENFLSITPDGKLLYGIEGFNYWIVEYGKKSTYEEAAQEYVKTIENQKKYFLKSGWIDATKKLKTTLSETFISKLLFQDIYSYPLFGRTRLAKFVMYSKQVGAKELIRNIASISRPTLLKIIEEYKIDAIAFIPPTVPRPVQFMDEFARLVHINLPQIELIKVIPGEIPIPQKTLPRLNERIINAKNSIYIKYINKFTFKNILLIDDVAGSGASFNETAKKLKERKAGENVIAFALVGNLKGYDVVREM